MDPLFLDYLARKGVFTPILVSLWFLVRLWRTRELFGTSGAIFFAWFVIAAIAQIFAPSIGVWIAAMLVQVTLAITLVLKQQLADIA